MSRLRAPHSLTSGLRTRLPPELGLPLVLGALLLTLFSASALWLEPALMASRDTVSSLTAQRDQLAQEASAASEELALLARVADGYRALDTAGAFADHDRVTLVERLDARLAAIGIDGARYKFLPIQETRVDIGGFPLLRRTVPIEVSLTVTDDRHVSSFVRLEALGHAGLLRVETLTLRRAEGGTAEWLELAASGRLPTVARAEMKLSWTTLAPVAGATP